MNSNKLNIDKNLAEFYGILIGDGCISRYICENRERFEFRIDGHSLTDYDYFTTFLTKLIYEITGKQKNIKFRKDCNGIFIRFHSKSFAILLNKELNFPFGKKGNIGISNKFMKKNSLLKCVLRGIFDTDGCLYFTKNSFNKLRNYPIIEISSHSQLLITQLMRLLNDLGFTCKLSFYKDSLKIHGRKGLLRWFNLIGSNHPDKNSKFLYWKKYGVCPRIDELNFTERNKLLLGP